MEQAGNYAFVTLATDDMYGNGALVLAHSLRIVNTNAKLVVLVTSGVNNSTRDKLNKVYDLVEDVTALDSQDDNSLMLMKRPELGITFTKIHCWRLSQFSKCVFLDADTLVLKNCDELFERQQLSAVSDVGWPDCFNSGVFVFQPSEETYQNLLKAALLQGSFDGGDQGLLNMYFNDWASTDISKHLSFIYNMNVSSSYTYLPAFKHFGQNVKIVHFLGNKKPWMYHYNRELGTIDASSEENPSYEYIKYWWKIYVERVDETFYETSMAKSISDLTLSPNKESSNENASGDRRASADEANRMSAWEQGNIDYLGRDSFENIQKKIDDVINGSPK